MIPSVSDMKPFGSGVPRFFGGSPADRDGWPLIANLVVPTGGRIVVINTPGQISVSSRLPLSIQRGAD